MNENEFSFTASESRFNAIKNCDRILGSMYDGQANPTPTEDTTKKATRNGLP